MIYTQWRRSSSAPIHVISYSLLWSVICTVLIKSPEILSSCCLTHPLLPSNGFPLVEPIVVPLTIITDLPFSSIWWLCSCWSLGNGPSRRSWKELLWRKSMHMWSVKLEGAALKEKYAPVICDHTTRCWWSSSCDDGRTPRVCVSLYCL